LVFFYVTHKLLASLV